jgi:pSer/pThr/pTyr-binding forkhead associated (FHA) protein
VRVLPLEDVTLGRDDECEVILDEGPVSRLHAKVAYHDYQPEVHDLGSTNGTYLNGKRVHRAFLQHGDRLQVGANVFEVRLGAESSQPAADPASDTQVRNLQSELKKKKSATQQQMTAISGRIAEIRLTSLLQIIESDRATGTLVVLSNGREGKLHIHQGAVRHATFGRASGLKALYRLMALDEGSFDLYIPGRNPDFDTVEGDLQKHLLEAMRQKDEVAVFRKALPADDARLVFTSEKALPLARVPPAVFEVMASISRYHTVGDVIEHCDLPDFEVCRVLGALLKHRIVAAEPSVSVGATSSAS